MLVLQYSLKKDRATAKHQKYGIAMKAKIPKDGLYTISPKIVTKANEEKGNFALENYF